MNQLRRLQYALGGLSLCLLFSCSIGHSKNESEIRDVLEEVTPQEKELNPAGAVISTRFSCPSGASREKMSPTSFAHYLRHLPLKKDGSPVLYYDGGTKNKADVYAAVVEMQLDNQDLQQCADAVMRLRGEYLFSIDRKNEIHFDFVSDGEARYFSDYAKGDMSYGRFRKYMRYIFSYANTASLKNELAERDIKEMQIGDVFIQKGVPYGHAVIVVDMCKNLDTGIDYFMLAQSYMPAQDTQILLNPLSDNGSVWYQITNDEVKTPEWTFLTTDLHQF